MTYTPDLNSPSPTVNIAPAFKPLTKEDIADVLGVSGRTIENWVNDGTLPSPTRLGSRVYWHPGIFFGWLEQRLMASEPPELPRAKVANAAPAAGSRKPVRHGAKSVKTEAEQLRARDQAKLGALMS